MQSADENKMILSCLSAGRSRGKKKLRMEEIDPFCDNSDAITKMADKLSSKQNRKMRQNFKYKLIDKWTGADFLKYITSLLSQYGTDLKSSGVKEQDLINKLYDTLLIKIGEGMNNSILKEYIEWWIASKTTKYQYKGIYVQSFLRDNFIDEYIQDFHKLPTTHDKSSVSVVSESEVYKAGGMLSLLLSKGIVITYNFLKSSNETNIINRIGNVLMSSSKDMLLSIMDSTLKNAPYAKHHIVDFLSIAKQSLVKHNITEYSKVDYKTMFQKEVKRSE